MLRHDAMDTYILVHMLAKGNSRVSLLHPDRRAAAVPVRLAVLCVDTQSDCQALDAFKRNVNHNDHLKEACGSGGGSRCVMHALPPPTLDVQVRGLEVSS